MFVLRQYSCDLCRKRFTCLPQRFYAVGINDSLPRITVPHKMMQRIENAKKRKIIRESRIRKPVYKSALTIACGRTEYNHHKGQSYKDFDVKNLASHGWKHRKSAGDHFTLLSYAKNPAIEKDGYEQQVFTDFNLHERLLSGLEDMGIETPTKIQSLVIPRVLEGRNVVCAAETGSGKTLAYLLPIIELLHRQNSMMASDGKPLLNSPKALIIVPARELAQQIMSVAEQLAKHAEFIPWCIHGQDALYVGHGESQLRKKRMDVLIATPGILRQHLFRKVIKPSSLQYVILDEADTLFDDSFNIEVRHIIEKLGISVANPLHMENNNEAVVESGVQMLLVSATMPTSRKQIIGDLVPIESFTEIMTGHLHHLMPHVPQKFMRLLPSHKPEALMKLVKKNDDQHVPTMIFCNTSETCYFVHKILEDSGITNLLMSGQIKGLERAKQFDKFQEGYCDIIVCTDIASRGLDTIRVQHIINYDCPNFISDYIHRAGRVGRVKSRGAGHVVTFISQKWDVELLWNIETSARRSTELHNVNANIKRKLIGLFDEKHGPA